MKIIKIILLAMLISIFPTWGSESDIKKIHTFSTNLINIIKLKDMALFGKIHIYPQQENADRYLKYIFKANKKHETIVKLFSNRHLSIKVYGPYVDSKDNKYYSILYFLSNLIALDEYGHITDEVLKKEWVRSLIITNVIIHNNQVQFYSSPFYLERHAPWAEEYG